MILNIQKVINYLKSKKLIDLNSKPIIEKLQGGWLNPIFLIKSGNKSFVVKQILSTGKKGGRFEDFNFPRERMLNEYYALRISNKFAPGFSPKVLGVDFQNFIIILEYIDNYLVLEELLKKYRLNDKTADSMIEFLIKIHNSTINKKKVELAVSHKSYWNLKYHYQYLNVECSTAVKEKIRKFVGIFSGRRFCLVHGDYNTKNILVRPDNSIAAIDFEETGYSDPAHDIGTILAHLIIFKQMNNNVSEKQIRHMFHKYLKKINFKNKRGLAKSIVFHTASIILSRLNGKIMYEFIPEKLKPRMKYLSEKAILEDYRDIGCLLM